MYTPKGSFIPTYTSYEWFDLSHSYMRGLSILSLGHLHVSNARHDVKISCLAGDRQKVSEMMKSTKGWLMRTEKWLRASDSWKESKNNSRESKSDNGNGLLHDDTQNPTTTPASLRPSVALSLLLRFSLSSNMSLCFPHHFTFDLSFHNVCSWHWERKRTKRWREAMRTHKERSSLSKLPAHYILELRK